MNTASGFDVIKADFPAKWKNKRIGVLCHAPSISRDFVHIIDYLAADAPCRLTAIFGPQHGICGETQDNMIEWNSFVHPFWKVPVYSLYGEHRKPTPEMLKDVDLLIVDVQDVGTRVYTYMWTLRLCMERCAEMGIPVAVLDRPNPIGFLKPDGAILKREFFTFVGMAEIPLCHALTIGEIALFLQQHEVPECRLEVIKMKNYNRKMRFEETGLNWVPPSPNMPTERTAAVYPGAVLIEALNLSEARGTTTPFELFGAPFINSRKLLTELNDRKISGCRFRMHDYIPTFHKFAKTVCHGVQIHVTEPEKFRPVRTFVEIFRAIMKTSEGSLRFLPPPYEYERELTPFDILAGDSKTREMLQSGTDPLSEFARWDEEMNGFTPERLYC